MYPSVLFIYSLLIYLFDSVLLHSSSLPEYTILPHTFKYRDYRHRLQHLACDHLSLLLWLLLVFVCFLNRFLGKVLFLC